MPSKTVRANAASDATYSIRVVARLSGISADTLRMWQRRYGFPSPVRNDRGNRVYSKDDVERLVLISRAMQAGYRPGEIVSKRARDLERLLSDAARAPVALVAEPGEVAAILRAVTGGDVSGARQKLRQMAVSRGARGFVVDVAGPLLEQTGLAWAAGRIEIHHEHLISELLASQIRLLHSAYDDLGGAPAVVMTTLPQEQHRLGLDLAALYLATLGADVRMLGPNTPADQIVRAAKAGKVDVVAVSVSRHADAPAAAGYLSWIAGELPDSTELWVGGSGALRVSLEASNARVVTTWDDLAENTLRVRTGR